MISKAIIVYAVHCIKSLFVCVQLQKLFWTRRRLVAVGWIAHYLLYQFQTMKTMP